MIIWLSKEEFWARFERDLRPAKRFLTRWRAVDLDIPDLRARIAQAPVFTPADEEDFPGPVERWYGQADGALFLLTSHYRAPGGKLTLAEFEDRDDAEALVRKACDELEAMRPYG